MTDKDKAGTRSENVSKDGEFGEIKRSFLYGKHPSPFSHEYEQEWFFEAGRQVERDAHAERVKPLVEAGRKKIDASTLQEHTAADAEVCAAIADIDALTDREGESEPR